MSIKTAVPAVTTDVRYRHPVYRDDYPCDSYWGYPTHHRVAGAIRSIHDSVVGHIDPLAIDPHAIVTIPGVPIGIVDALRIAATPMKQSAFSASNARLKALRLASASPSEPPRA